MPLPFINRRNYTRQVQAAAYHAAVATGYISKQRLVVYNWIWAHGPCSQNEAAVALLPAGKTNWGVITTRFSELERQLAIEQIGVTINPQSKCEVTLYDITNRRVIPHVAKPKPTKVWIAFDSASGYGFASLKKEEAVRALVDLKEDGRDSVRLFHATESKPPKVRT